MARDKDILKTRNEAMLFAYELAKSEGIDALASEIKRRGLLGTPMTASRKEAEHFWNELSTNMYLIIIVTMMSVLKDSFGFDGDELKRLKREYEKAAENCMDVDYMGEHYVKLEDYAVELNEELGMDFDVARIAGCQDHYDGNNKDSNYHWVKVEKIISKLKDEGFADAADFLQNKLED